METIVKMYQFTISTIVHLLIESMYPPRKIIYEFRIHTLSTLCYIFYNIYITCTSNSSFKHFMNVFRLFRNYVDIYHYSYLYLKHNKKNLVKKWNAINEQVLAFIYF